MTLHRSCTPRARRELRRCRPLEHRHSGCTGATAASGDSDTPPWGPHPRDQTTRLAGQHRAADPQDGPRAAESEAAADSTGTTTRRPLITTTAHGPGTRRLRPNQWSKLDTQNRTTSGNRVTAHNAHELFIPLRAATFWANFGWIVASTCGAPATHNHFLLLSKPFAPAGRFTHTPPYITRSLTDTSRRSGNTPSLSLCSWPSSTGPPGLDHVTLRPPGARSRDSPRLPFGTLPRLLRPRSASLLRAAHPRHSTAIAPGLLTYPAWSPRIAELLSTPRGAAASPQRPGAL